MIIAAIYPVFLWFFVYRLRRTWQGVALVTVGTLAVWPIAQIVQIVAGSLTGGVLAKLVYAEMALIGLVSLWLVFMKRPSSVPLCPYCRYDLTGLPLSMPGFVCPECGHILQPAPSDPTEPFCLACGQRLTNLDQAASGQTCPSCGADESEFGNWTRAKAVRARAEAERARSQGRSIR